MVGRPISRGAVNATSIDHVHSQCCRVERGADKNTTVSLRNTDEHTHSPPNTSQRTAVKRENAPICAVNAAETFPALTIIDTYADK